MNNLGFLLCDRGAEAEAETWYTYRDRPPILRYGSSTNQRSRPRACMAGRHRPAAG
jgi:hypothetical protein